MSELAEMEETKGQKRMLTRFFSRQVPHIPTQDERVPYPEKSANITSRIFFWWLHPVMQTGYKRTLDAQDMFLLTDDLKVQRMANEFMEHFSHHLAKARLKHVAVKCKERGESVENSSVNVAEDLEDFKVSKTIILWSLFLTFKWQYSWSCVALALGNVSQTTSPLLTKRLIAFVERKALGIESGVGKGLGYSFGTISIIFIMGLLNNQFYYYSMLTGAQVKGLLTKAILDKSFKLDARSKHKYTSGKITSIMTTDLSRIDFALGYQSFLFVFPVPISIAIAILIVNIGVSALVGISLMLVFLAVIIGLSRLLFKYRKEINKFTDSRINYTKEALNNLKIIKFYSWEPPYGENISKIRREEMKLVRKIQTVRNTILTIAMSLTLVSSMISFLVLYAVGSDSRNPAAIFSSISLFAVLSQQFIMLPSAISSGTDALLGFGRLGDFLGSQEIDPNSTKIHATEDERQDMDNSDVAIEVSDGLFEWETFNFDDDDDESTFKRDDTDPEVDDVDLLGKEKDHFSEASSEGSVSKVFSGLQDINLTIKKSEFIVITGVIGSGKSSLLSALSGFMKRTGGRIKVNGSLLLCGYPWVQNATVKENILFGLPYDETKYREVIYSCSLESDLDVLPAGDNTEIGERGINLSGGQKARINLARAVYANKDIILLDDVLSAVDAGVGKHIMDNCLLGLLKNKTRILATHQLSLISSANRIIFLNGDGTIDTGSFEELRARSSRFEKLMTFSSEAKVASEENEDELEEFDDVILKSEFKAEVIAKEDDEAIHKEYNSNNTSDGKLIGEEERAINRIKGEIYTTYLRAGSGKFGPGLMGTIFFTVVVLFTFCDLFSNTWLSFWTSYKFPSKGNNFYIGLYVLFTILSVMLLFIEFCILLYITNKASVMLNIKATNRILHAPMSFMDTTPTGRVLNRFTKDTETLDNVIGNQIRFLIYFIGSISGVLILSVCYVPWFAITYPFLGFLCVVIADYYQASAREIKRLEAVQRSLVYSHFNETLGGMNTIKSYKLEKMFLGKNEKLLDQQNESYFLTIANQRWLSIHMDLISSIFSIVVCVLCVFRVFNISASSVGLLLSYVFQISAQMTALINTYTQVENEMNSVERLSHYAYNIPEEAPYVITETTPKETWPEHGAIRFSNVNFAYRPGLPLVLKNVSFEVNPSEKIGICGRTGAGKSSIMTALYRLSELQDGKIEIDDIDVSTLGLKSLRSKLSIIPQDPVLFRGTIRKNLDPFNDSSDEKLWDALRRTGLVEESKLDMIKKQKKPENRFDKSEKKEILTQQEEKADGEEVALHKFHLDQAVDDEGANFSLGERQLIAFARALVRDSKILILDEATSSVDYETDAKIQETIAREFSNCTILCIAHRLKTILDYDKILVLDKGQVTQFGTPFTLFKTDNSIFQQMCKRSNITEDDFQIHE